MTPVHAQLAASVVDVLTPDLAYARFRKPGNVLAGQCYAASEALYHLLGGKAAGWKPMCVWHEGTTHWYLQHANGSILDVTAGQYDTQVPHEDGIGKGFLTKRPSRRAQTIIDRIRSAA